MSERPLQGLRSVAGQPRAIDLLTRAITANRLASSYLFEGPDGVGKERTARALAQCMVCQNPLEPFDACGQCPPCRQVNAKTHVDVITLAREIDVLSQQEHNPNDVKSEIVVEKIRQLQADRLAYQSFQGSRWVIVRDAHLLNTSASNALLKTLEEPPTNTHFVLVTARPAFLLTTIRSRCQRVRFGPLEESLVKDLLLELGVQAAIAPEVARLSDGSMATAMQYSNAELLAARKTWVERVVTALRTGRPGRYVDLAEDLKELGKSEQNELSIVLTMIERHFRDEALKLVDQQPQRAAVCAERAELVRYMVESLDRNLNLQMALESLFVRLREV